MRHKCRSTLIFAINVAHIAEIVTLFQQIGIEAKGLDSCTEASERELILKEFGEQKFPVLVNCGIVAEGVDIPAIDSLILARPTKSAVLLQQMVGRGMRLHPSNFIQINNFKEKKFCRVYDLVDNINNDFSRATIPTLMGLPPCFVFENQMMYDTIKKIESPANNQDLGELNVLVKSVELKPFVNPFGMKSVTDDEIDIFRYTNFAWVRVGPKRWILDVSNAVAGSYYELAEKSIFLTYIFIDAHYICTHFRKNIAYKSEKIYYSKMDIPIVKSSEEDDKYQMTLNEKSDEKTKIFVHDKLSSAFHAVDTLITRSYKRFHLYNW